MANKHIGSCVGQGDCALVLYSFCSFHASCKLKYWSPMPQRYRRTLPGFFRDAAADHQPEQPGVLFFKHPGVLCIAVNQLFDPLKSRPQQHRSNNSKLHWLKRCGFFFSELSETREGHFFLGQWNLICNCLRQIETRRAKIIFQEFYFFRKEAIKVKNFGVSNKNRCRWNSEKGLKLKKIAKRLDLKKSGKLYESSALNGFLWIRMNGDIFWFRAFLLFRNRM